MQLRVPAKSRLWPAFLAAAAVTATVAMMDLTPTPEAHAEPGRRICRYVWDQQIGNPEQRAVSFVADYEKSGACPNIDPHKIALPKEIGAWMPPPDTWEHAPVPKLTCEEFQTLLNLPSAASGDPCTYMENDRLYAVTSFKPGDIATTRRFYDLPSIWDLRY